MGTNEEFQRVAEKLNAYNIRFTDVWLEHLCLTFEVGEVDRERSPPETLMEVMFSDEKFITIFGIVCSIQGSLFKFKQLQLPMQFNDSIWDNPTLLREILEKMFDARYKSYYESCYNSKYGKAYRPPVALQVKLDYDHHRAQLKRSALQKTIEK